MVDFYKGKMKDSGIFLTLGVKGIIDGLDSLIGQNSRSLKKGPKSSLGSTDSANPINRFFPYLQRSKVELIQFIMVIDKP